jgi:hypothetical protein
MVLIEKVANEVANGSKLLNVESNCTWLQFLSFKETMAT